MRNEISQNPAALQIEASQSYTTGMWYYLGIEGVDRNQTRQPDHIAYTWFRDSFKMAHTTMVTLQGQSPVDVAAIEAACDLYCNAGLMMYKSALRYESSPLILAIELYSLKKKVAAQNWKVWRDAHGNLDAWERLLQISSPLSQSAKRQRSNDDDEQKLVNPGRRRRPRQ